MTNITTTKTLLGIMRDEKTMQPPVTWWLDRFFTDQVDFETEEIEFGKLAGSRKMAPLVMPERSGRPIYSAAERVDTLRPAYLKPKDPITPGRLIKKIPGLGELAGHNHTGQMTPKQRRAVLEADILRTHYRAIRRRWNWMAAKAVIDGKVTLSGPDYETRVVDFRRDPALNVVLSGSDRWDQGGVDILGQITQWRSIMRNVVYGGPANVLLMGTEAYDAFIKDPAVLKQLDKNSRIGQTPDLVTGVRKAEDYEFVGYIAEGLPVVVVSETYDDLDETTGNVVVRQFMDPKEVVLAGNVEGVRCFGAILDLEALVPLPIFPKMILEQDPSRLFILTQSAPLMVPMNPNRTLRAKVLS